jgi:hypothetical protein
MSKSFFLPNDLFPPTGPTPPIRLGQLIEDIKDPGMELADTLDFTEYVMTVSDMPVSVVRNFDAHSYTAQGVYTNAAVQLGQLLSSSAFNVWSTALAIMLVIIWLANMACMIRGDSTGNLLGLVNGWSDGKVQR